MDGNEMGPHVWHGTPGGGTSQLITCVGQSSNGVFSLSPTRGGSRT
jgi:hypothetical protein